MELDNDNYFRAEMVGLVIKNSKGFFVVNVANPNADHALMNFLQNKSFNKICFDVKKIINFFARFNIALTGVTDDVMMMGYLIDSRVQEKLPTHIHHYLDREVLPHKKFFSKRKKGEASLTEGEINDYIISKLNCICALYNKLKPLISKNDMRHLYYDIELPSVFAFARMERNGIKFNMELYHFYCDKLEREIGSLEKNIAKMFSKPININSPKQLAQGLYEDLKLPQLDKKSQTDKKTLIKIRDVHPIINLILKYRQLSVMYSRYLKGVAKHLFPGDVIHTMFRNAATSTGRIASVNPNMQNLAVKNESQEFIRKLFIPVQSGNIFLSADYSQIDLKAFAHLSGDKTLIDAFEHHQDIHTVTAMKLFNKSSAQLVTPLERRQAKVMNFGLLYGVTAFTVQNTLQISHDEAKALIAKFHATNPKMLEFKKDLLKNARMIGYVQTLNGRRRYLDDLFSSNKMVQATAERMAVNMPIQGLSADIIKIAMVKIDNEICAKGYQSKLVLQVHDELVIEVIPAEIAAISELVLRAMTTAMTLSVPLDVRVSTGDNLLNLKE